jgi:uncharacterized protein
MLDRRVFLSSGLALAARAASQLKPSDDAEWRRQRIERLKGDEGWLTLTGLHWLEPGANHLPSAPGLTFTRRREAVTLEAAESVLVNGKLTRKHLLKKDEDQVVIGSRTYFVIVRGDRVAIRERDKLSPYRTSFKGLKLYPFQPALRIAAVWQPYPKPVKRRIPTVANTVDEMMAPGRAEFTLNSVKLSLEPVIEEDHLFYIFKDQTAGKSTYPAGRFMEMPMPKDGVAIIDFNRAYNPPCAFTPYATCPLPLKQNQLPVAIEAGEFAYHYE